MGSTFDTHTTGPYDIQIKIQSALQRYGNVVHVEIVDIDKGVIRVDTGFPNNRVPCSFWVEWTSADEIHERPSVSVHSEGGYFFITNPRMIAEVSQVILMPTTRLLLCYHIMDGGNVTQHGFAIDGRRIQTAYDMWCLRHPTDHRLLINAAVWEDEPDRIEPKKEEEPKQTNRSGRKLNIEGIS